MNNNLNNFNNLFWAPEVEGVWISQSPIWEVRVERLTPALNMCCWRRPVGYVNTSLHPYGWIRVYPVGRSHEKLLYEEEHKLEGDAGPLELECIAHMLRNKYTSKAAP